MTITSHHNRKLKEIRKLRQRRRWRERSGRFVAEGEDLLAAADAAGWQAVERYCAAGSGLLGIEVERDLLASASGLGSGTRTLAVYDERWADRPVGPLCVYLHGLQDPGNVGAILRSAQAFGASSVALGPGTADPFGLKAVRASMGAIFAVRLAKVGGLSELPGAKIALVPGQGSPLHELWRSGQPGVDSGGIVREEAAAPRDVEEAAGPRDVEEAAGPRDVEEAAGPRDVEEAADPRDVAEGPRDVAAPAEVSLLIGAERDGLPREVVEQADITAHIPIQTDSLNAAMAATIALYEVGTRMARE